MGTRVRTISVFVATGKPDNQLISSADDAGYAEVEAAVLSICSQLAQLLVKDGEGATKFVEVLVSGRRQWLMRFRRQIGRDVELGEDGDVRRGCQLGPCHHGCRLWTPNTSMPTSTSPSFKQERRNPALRSGNGCRLDEELAKKILGSR